MNVSHTAVSIVGSTIGQINFNQKGESDSTNDGTVSETETDRGTVETVGETEGGTNETENSQANGSNASGLYQRGSNKSQVLIICNFADKDLIGYKEDVKMLENMWEEFGCNVTVQKNLSAESMDLIVLKFATDTCTGNESFVAVFVLSHGEKEDLIVGADKKTISVSEILKRFNNENRNLQHIPKLFFFQICRGGISDQGEENTQAAYVQKKPPLKLPQVCDTLVTYASQKETRSYVSENHGSWFIQAIIEVFQENARRMHVVDMLTMVNDKMAEEMVKNSTDTSILGAKAMSEFTSTLRRKLYIFGGPQ
uniref:caspase-2-like n=1 Tax=Styela clava TaxID=7725 RepID=UPI00193987A4|nr:caspase-2-like [Styela clava]